MDPKEMMEIAKTGQKDQTMEAFRDFADHLAAFYDQLCKGGFKAPQALALTHQLIENIDFEIYND